MATAREIQSRIKSIQDTMKITNAMYMISSSKLKKAKKSLAQTQPYFDGLQNTIRRMLRHVPEMEHPFFENGKGQNQKRGYIVITADKGLAGAYNHNVIKLTEDCLKQDGENLLFVVGEFGREYFSRRSIPIDTNFGYTVQDPTLSKSRDIAARVIGLYLEGSLNEVYVVYTQTVNAMTVEAKALKLLPLTKERFREEIPADVHAEEIRLVPSAQNVIDNVVPDYVTGFIYGALVESFCSEQNARMMAMQAATDSAQKMLHSLRTDYNRVRQGAITQEITEVIAGAKAQKKKKQKRKADGSRI